MQFRDGSDRTRANHFDSFTQSVFSGALITHLSNHTRFRSNFSHDTSFADGPGQRLLNIDMFLGLHRLDRGCSMSMVRGADAHDVNFVAELIQHLTEVGELFGLGEFFRLLGQCTLIDITDANDFHILIGDVTAVAVTFTTDSNTGGRQTFQRRTCRLSECLWSNPERSSQCGRTAEKTAT